MTTTDVIETQMATAITDSLSLTPIHHQPSEKLMALASPLDLARIALARGGANIETLERMLVLHREWEADEARKAFNTAFAAFKAANVTVVRGKLITDGPLKGKRHAELVDVVRGATAALSEHGLSTSWRIIEDSKDWIRVECTLKHAAGHSESVAMGGAPDSGPGRNAIQARCSTTTYLQRYTLMAILGLAASDMDDDGHGGASETDAQKKAAKSYDEARFTANLPSWTDAVRAGKDPSRLIAFIESKGVPMSEGQKAMLLSIKKDA